MVAVLVRILLARYEGESSQPCCILHGVATCCRDYRNTAWLHFNMLCLTWWETIKLVAQSLTRELCNLSSTSKYPSHTVAPLPRWEPETVACEPETVNR
jgi:hypothetical protein